MSNYFVSKDKKSGEILYLEFDKEKSYEVKPKVKKKDAIEVNKIVFVSPSLTEKLIKKKIELKINRLLEEFNTISDEDNDDDGSMKVRDKLVEAERLKLAIINNYVKYLGKEYANLTLEKLEIIISGYRSRLYALKRKNEEMMLIDLFNHFTYGNENEKKGRGR